MNETDKEDDQEQAVVSEESPSPGELLSRARKEKGLSIDEVVPHLGLPARVLKALEENDYDRLPAAMYVRGYVRRYCALLEIAEEPVLDAVEQQLTQQGISDHTPSLRLLSPPQRKLRIRPSYIVVPLLVVLLVAIAMFVWAMQADEKSVLPEVQQLQMPFEPALETNQYDTTRVAELEALEDPASGEQSQEAVVEDDGIRTLFIRVIQQSWVEVFDAEGDMLVADLKPSGTDLEVIGLAPFKVTLGYAPGVEISYAGDPIAIDAIAKDNTATLKIGDDSAGEH